MCPRPFCFSTPSPWPHFVSTAFLFVPIVAVGTMTAYVAFDLDPGSGFFSWAMYFAITVLLRLVIGLSAIPGLPSGAGRKS